MGALEVFPDSVAVRKNGELLSLTTADFRLLLTLARAPRQVFSREALPKDVWGYDYLSDSGTLADVP